MTFLNILKALSNDLYKIDNGSYTDIDYNDNYTEVKNIIREREKAEKLIRNTIKVFGIKKIDVNKNYKKNGRIRFIYF